MSCETLAKKAARYRVWHRVREDLGEDRFKRSRFLYLAGPDGGDASVLAGFGVPPDCQLAVDMDAAALASFHEKHPDVPTFHGSVADVQGHFDVIFLDFYCNLENPNLGDWLRQGWRRLARRDDSYFVFAVLKGREYAQFGKIATLASELKRWARSDVRALAAEYGCVPPTSTEVTEFLTRIGWDDQAYRSHARIQFIVNHLGPAVRERRLSGRVEFMYAYHGRSPMLIFGMTSQAFPRKWSEEKFAKQSERQSQSRAEERLRSGTLLRAGLHQLENHDAYELLALVESDGFYDEAHLLLNMPRKNVAALRAVRTRRAGPVDGQPTTETRQCHST